MRHEENQVKFTKQDFLTSPHMTIEIDEHISIDSNELLAGTQILSVPQCHVTGTLSFDGDHLVTSNLELEGVLMVPDSITDQALDVEFSAPSQQTYSFVPLKDAEKEDIVVVKKETLDLNPEIFQTILYEAPMSLTRLPRDQYPKGDGWQLLSDQDATEKKMDPRWEILNEFKLEDD
jgi:uncharacterized protein